MSVVTCFTAAFLENLVLIFLFRIRQATLQALENEVALLRESASVQKKRLSDAVASLLKDLGDIGNVIGGDCKVCLHCFNCFLSSAR
jgi:hypothetical protein